MQLAAIVTIALAITGAWSGLPDRATDRAGAPRADLRACQDPDPRPEPPSPAETERILKQLRALWPDLGKGTRKVRAENATRLLAEGRKTAGNPADQRYVCLKLALDEALALGSPEVVLGALSALEEFRLDVAELRFTIALQRIEVPGELPPGTIVDLLVSAAAGWLDTRPILARKALREAERQLREIESDTARADDVAALFDRLEADPRLRAHPREALPDDASRKPHRERIARRIAGFEDSLAPDNRRRVDDLLREAGTEPTEAAARLELLEAAQRIAEHLGDVARVARVIEEITDRFQLDYAARLVEAADRMDKARRPSPPRSLARLYLQALRAALATDFATARAAQRGLERCRDRYPGNPIYNELDVHCRQLGQRLDFLESLDKVQRAYAEKPEDKKAAHDLGWFLAIRCDNWSDGLPLLQRGEQWPFHLYAIDELQGPQDAAGMLKVANQWWDLAAETDRNNTEREALRRHAKDWYRRAQPEAGSLFGELIDKRLAVPDGPTAAAEAAIPTGAARPRPAAESPLMLGLGWLCRHQDQDGKWDCDQFMRHDTEGVPCDGPGGAANDIGVTGLALLALLGAGSTPNAGPYQENLRKGLGWLLAQQNGPKADDAAGRFGTAATHHFIYDHAIATLAMVRAYRATRAGTWKDSAQAALGYLDRHRNPYSVWRYQPRDNDNDLSVTGWCLHACVEGKAAGLVIGPETLGLVATFLEQVTTPDGRHGYTKAGEPSSRHRNSDGRRAPSVHEVRFPPERCETMTAVGLACRLALGQSRSREILGTSAQLLVNKPPRWNTRQGTIDEYYWYHGTLALRAMRGSWWSQWRTAVLSAVLDNQRKDGNARGSWDPVGVWGVDGGRVYATAMNCLTLIEANR